MPRKNARHHVLAVLGYSLITVLFTFPAAVRLTSHIPGGGDAPWFVWQLWWFKHAIVDLRQSPLTTDLIYHPVTDVPVTWQSPLNELAAIPLQAAFGPVVAYNLLILSTFILSGYCMYLLILQVIGPGRASASSSPPALLHGSPVRFGSQRLLAFLGGLIFAFCAYRGMHSLYHLSLATTQWMPLSLALAIGLWRKPTVRRAAAAGVAIGLVALASPYYVAYFLLPAGCVGLLYLILTRRSAITRQHIGLAVLALAISGAMIAPFYINFLAAPEDVKEAARAASASVYVYTADVLSWLLPPRNNPLWHNVTAGIYERFTTGYLVESTLFFGLAPLLLSLSWLVVRRQQTRPVGFWLALALTTLVLSFGPVLRFWQIDLVEWMPYRWFMLLPGSYAFRAPARIGITTVLACTVLTMIFFSHRLTRPGNQRLRRSLLAAWSGLLLVSMMVAFPYPSSSAALPPAYQQIAAAPGRGAVLDLPAGEIFQEPTSWAMYYQTFHQKPVVSGYLGRRPERLHEPERTLPFVRRFFSLDWTSYFAGDWQNLVEWPGPDEVLAGAWPDDIRNASALLTAQGIEYVVVHRNPEHPGYFESAGLLLTQGLGLPVYRDDNTLLFRARLPDLAGHGATDGLDDATLAFDSSFSEPTIHRQSQARSLPASGEITIDVPRPGRWLLRGQLDGREASAVTFSIDGVTAAPEVVHLFGDVFAWSLAADLPVAGPHVLTLHSPAAEAEPASTAESAQPCERLCLLNFTVGYETPHATSN